MEVKIIFELSDNYNWYYYIWNPVTKKVQK
jgi:hypothetical protein